MGTWSLIADFALPIPLVCIAILLAPAPRWFTRGALRMVERTLGLEFFHTFKLLHVMLFVSGAAFISTARTTAQIYSVKSEDDPMMNVPNMLSASLGKRWRAERNFWLSAFTFTLWCILARLYVVIKHTAKLNDRINELESKPLPEDEREIPAQDPGQPAGVPEPKKVA